MTPEFGVETLLHSDGNFSSKISKSCCCHLLVKNLIYSDCRMNVNQKNISVKNKRDFKRLKYFRREGSAVYARNTREFGI